MCCDPTFTKADHIIYYAHEQCVACGEDVDSEGKTIALSNCNWSPVECDVCGWRPCDLSC